MNYQKYLTMVAVAAFLVALTAFTVTAVDIPVGVERLTQVSSETINASQLTVARHNAMAGNVTRITLSGRSQTKHWQGYYGEVTGTIVLDDAQNWTLYDWPNTEPKGEIYATVNATTPNWLSVECFDYSAGAGVGRWGMNVSYWERFYNMTWNDVDGLDETFNMTAANGASQHPTFSVGAVTITGATCPHTYTHMTDAFQTDKFVEVLLQDSRGSLIFTTIIENDDEGNNTDPRGFDNAAHDFQMLVAEDGTSLTAGNRNVVTTTYYFYMDIE